MIKRYLFIGLLIISAAAILVSLKGQVTGMVVQEENLLLGYCPSMESKAREISGLNQGIEILPQESTADVLNSLKTGEIDLALVGRIAKASELQDATQRRIGSGYTLIREKKMFILKEELELMVVHTALDSDIAESLLPGSEIIYHGSVEEAIQRGIGQAVLISWDNFREEMELLVVMDGKLKAKEFRIPVLYSLNYDLGQITTR